MKPALLYGHRPAADFRYAGAPLDTSLVDDIALGAVQAHYALFEVPMETALACLPVSLHPAIPAHLGITFWRCEDGPLGAFECAWIGLACRTGIKPRHLVQSAFATSPGVAAWLQARYGFDCQVAEVQYRETYDRLRGRIVLDGATVLETVTTRMQPVVGAGAAVKFSPALNVARIRDAPMLVQMEASYAFKRVSRGTPQILAWDAAALGARRLAPKFPMSGAHALVDVTLHPPRFTADFVVPAEQGGARKISR